MTGDQQNPKDDSPLEFGEILINPHAGKSEDKELKPSSPPKPKKPRKPRKKKEERKEGNGSKKKILLYSLILLAIPVVLLLTYLLAARYLLPYYIQEQLASDYSKQLNRPIAVTEVKFSPFSFALHLAGLHIGPEFGHQNKNEPALSHIAAIDTHVDLQELLHGTVILKNVQVKGMQAELLRRVDGTFTSLNLSQANTGEKNKQSLLPNWLRIDGFNLTESMLVIRDATNNHEYHLDEITFSIPPATAQQEETVPTLHALVNGNPVQIQGQRQVKPNGSSATRLVLQLDNIDPQQLLAWLPGTSSTLRIKTEQTKAVLELILPDDPQDEEGIVLSGILSFAGMELKSVSTTVEADGAPGKILCKAPNAELVIQANPFRKQYRVEELTLEAPQIAVSGFREHNTQSHPPFSFWPGQLLKPTTLPIDLNIHRLTVHKGSIQRNQEPPWEDLLLELTNYQNREHPVHDSEEDNENKHENKAAGLSFSARQGKATVEFQGETTPDLSLTGSLSLNNFDTGTLQPYLGTNLQISGGRANLALQANSLQQQYTITELILHQPQLALTQSTQGVPTNTLPLPLWPGKLINQNSLPSDLMIHKLTIDKGTIGIFESKQKEKMSTWDDLQLELSNFRKRTSNSADNQSGKPPALSFTVHQGVTTVHFKGVTAPDLSLTGKISLHNLDSELLQPYLNSEHLLQLSGGRADLTGLLQTTQAASEKKTIHIEQGNIKLWDISIQQNTQPRAPLLTASITELQECSIGLTKPSLSCERLELQQADFSSLAPQFFLLTGEKEKEKSPLNLSVNTVKISDSKARLPLDGNAKGLAIPLTELNLDMKDLQAAPPEKDNLQLQADIGPDGRVKAIGSFGQGNGKLKLTGEDLDIKLLNPAFRKLFQKKLAPGLQQGRLSFQGIFRVPELDFEGDVTLKDLHAENKQGTALRWKNGQGKQVLVGMKPFFMHLDELILTEPQLKIPSSKNSIPEALTALLRTQGKKAVLPPFTMKQCRIQGGSMPGSGDRLGFTGVDGSLAHLAAGTPASFTFSGKVNEREFSTQGRLEQHRATTDKFTVAELPMNNVVKQFADQLRLNKEGKEGEIRWVPSAEQKNQGLVHFSGFLPQQDSDYALLLALLTDSTGTFSLSLPLPATASPAQISEAALKKLHRLHLQSVVSPQAVLEKKLPDLTLPQRVDFIVGDSLSDFMEELENFSSLLTRRPSIGLQLQGCYDDKADRKYLIHLLQEEEDYRIDLENVRRQEEMARLIAEEELRQVELINTDMSIGEDLIPEIEARVDLQPLPHRPVELPHEILPELARQRAKIVQEYLVDTLKLPAERITIAESAPSGPWVNIRLVPIWQQTSVKSSDSEEKIKE